jgi:phosphoserine phosphatase RsbU/P
MTSAADTIFRDSGPTARSIACMEIWGGSQTFDQSVSVPGNNVRICCTPYRGESSGGDIYYVSNCASGLITRFVLADISGHGSQVAQLATDLRKLMRRHINTANQTRFAVDLNRAFANLELDGKFATAVLATYFAPTDHLIICNAGHPHPLLFRASSNTWNLLDANAPGALATQQSGSAAVGIANLPLGVLDPTEYEQFALHLDPGDLVVLYTDALIEAADAEGRQLGESGLLALARALSPSERDDAASELRRMVVAYAGGMPFNDDATLIVLHHNAADPPRASWRGQVSRFARMLGLGAVDSEPGPEGLMPDRNTAPSQDSRAASNSPIGCGLSPNAAGGI